MTVWQVRNWQESVVYGADGPQPQVLLETDHGKVVLVGLEPGQVIPPHPAPASVYLVLEGTGWMTVDEQRVALQPGVIVTLPDNTIRGIQAETRMVFLGTRNQ